MALVILNWMEQQMLKENHIMSFELKDEEYIKPPETKTIQIEDFRQAHYAYNAKVLQDYNEVLEASSIDFSIPTGSLDLPEQTPVDDEKILQQIEDWNTHKKIKQDEALGI